MVIKYGFPLKTVKAALLIFSLIFTKAAFSKSFEI